MENQEQPQVDNTVEKQVIKKKKPTIKKQTDEPVKLDMNAFNEQKQEDTVDAVVNLNEPKQETTDSATDDARVEGSNEATTTTPQQEEVQAEGEAQEQPAVIQEVTEEEVAQVVDKVEEAVAEAVETGKPLPENIQKLVDFMEETGGDIQDYVALNRDLTKLDNDTALRDYYRKTKPHLSEDEITFMMEDNFNYDEDVDDERDVRRKKLALKEEVANAKQYLEDQKSKYYDEIKAGSKLTAEQQKAMDFFNRYNKETEESQKRNDVFKQRTNNLFNDKFKGFEYKVGDKRYRYNVNNVNEIKETQSDLNNFVKKFLNEDGTINNAEGYHKSLFTAMNADSIAQHFYEQGKADALKDSVQKSKNVDMSPRQSHGNIELGGVKYRVVSGESSRDFKIKSKRK